MQNSHKKWTKYEETDLLNLYINKKKSIYEISNILQRTEWAIQIRLGKLAVNNNNTNYDDIISIIKDIRFIKSELSGIKDEISKIKTFITYIEV